MADNVHFNVTNDFDRAQRDFNRLGNSIASTSRRFDSSTNSFNRMRNSVRNLSQDGNTTANSFNRMSRAMNTFKQGLNIFVVNKMAEGIAKVIQNSMDAIEILNMFEVSMGTLAEETDKELQSINELSGIDLTTLRQATGTFTLLAKSMGMSGEAATMLGKNATKMAVDLSSLFNIPINQVMADLKSGLIGQTETVYKYGMDLTEASLSQEALRLGIDKSVRTMSQGEKMFLRMSVATRQASGSMGDFARTIETPANQVRLLGENLLTLSRTIGNVFMPVLGTVLPYLRAFVMVLNELFRALGFVFGFSSTTDAKDMEDKFTGVGGAADGLGDSMGGATGKAKKLKKAIDDISAPFDELNTVNIPDPSSGSGGGGSGGGLGGLDPAILASMKDYDMMLGGVKQKASDIRDKVMEWLGFQQRVDEATGQTFWKLKDGYTNFEKIGDIVKAISVGLLAWKIENALLDNSKGIGKDFATIRDRLAEIIPLYARCGMGMTLSAMFPWVATFATFLGITVTMLGGWVAAIVLMIARFNDLNQSSKTFQDGVTAIKDGLGKAFDALVFFIGKLGEAGAFILSPFAGLFKAIKKGIEDIGLDMGDLMITLGGFALLFTPAAPIGVALLVFEGISTAIRAIGYAASDCVDEVDVLGGVSDETANKMRPMMDRLSQLDDVFAKLNFTGKIIDDSVIEDVAKKTAAIRENILNELDADKNASLATLAPLKKALGDEAYAELLTSSDKYYEDQSKKVTDGEARINEILANAKNAPNGARALTQTEADEIKKIREGMTETTVKAFSQSDIEVQRIMNNLKDATTRISVEQASEIIKSAQKARDDTTSAAETQYATQILLAQNMYEAGEINSTQYQAMCDAAKKTKEETCKSAEDQYNGILATTQSKFPELSTYIDLQTGNIRTKWDGFCKGQSKFWGDMWTDLENACGIGWGNITKFFDTYIIPWFGAERWYAIGSCVKTGLVRAFKETANAIIGVFESMINWIVGALNKIQIHIPPMLGFGGANVGINIPYANIPRLARGGMLDDGMMFEAGEGGKAEILGQYNNKTTVMPLENSGFVEAMYQAVYSAVSSAQSSGGQTIEVVTLLDGEVVYKNQQKVASGRGVEFGLGEFAR